MRRLLFRVRQFFRFYGAAVTKYQLHSPFVFELTDTILENNTWYYAFEEVERIRDKMLTSNVVLKIRDFGVGNDREVPLSKLVGRAASSTGQGQRLFRLANWANPRTMLELGTSVGVGAMYLASGARSARFLTLEGCPEIAGVAAVNLELLGFKDKVEILVGSFEETLQPALEKLQVLDLVYFDGNHRQVPTTEYFEKCLLFSNERTMFVFDDVHWSPEMEAAWVYIQQHPRVTLTVDFFDLSLAFINPDFKQKQHLKIVPSRWKIWKFI